MAMHVQYKLVCSADITKGSPNVYYGAATEQVLLIVNTEKILSLIGTGILVIAFGIEAAIIGYVVTSVIGDLADTYLGEGWGDIINGTLGFLALGLGVINSRRSARPGNVRAGETPRTGGYGSRVADTATEGVRNFEGRIRNEPLERGQFFDESGQPRSEEITGSENAIDISKGKGVAEDAIFTHNHPNNGNFSAADLTTATNYNMAEMRATTQNGNTYSMKRGPDGWNVKSPQEMNAIFKANQDAVRNSPEAQRLYREGNHDAVNDMLMEGIARDIGGIYNRH